MLEIDCYVADKNGSGPDDNTAPCNLIGFAMFKNAKLYLGQGIPIVEDSTD